MSPLKRLDEIIIISYLHNIIIDGFSPIAPNFTIVQTRNIMEHVHIILYYDGYVHNIVGMI